MKFFTKLLSVVTVAALATVSASAYDSGTRTAMYIQPEAGSLSIESSSDTTYGLSFGYGVESEKFDFYGDFGIRSYSNSGNDSGDYETSVGISMGYNVYNGIRPYGTVGYVAVGDLGGYYYGAGVNYRIIEHIGINASYKLGSVDLGYGPSYDYSEILVGLRFDFDLKRR